jgi:glycerate 2-kinase
MKIVVAPNAFKGTLSAPAAAAAIARGVREVFPDAEVVEVPVADGGDGTTDALVAANRGVLRTVEVEGPLGDPTLASYGLIDGGRTGVVDLASASGLALIAPERRDPRKASTFGFGRLLRAARGEGVDRLIVGVGGSATNDGGAGMAQALGYRLLDDKGRDLPRGGAALLRLWGIRSVDFDRGWFAVEVIVACDVTNPLTGPNGASYVYGPQKGADPETVALLDRALDHFGDLIQRYPGPSIKDIPGSGAAGGTGAGLVAFLNATLVPGAPLVVEASGFDRKLKGARLVITGEGRADSQTAYGKAPGEVAKRAQKARIPVLLIAGTKGPGWEALRDLGVTSVVTLDEEGDQQQLMRDAGERLTRAAARACRNRAWG